MGTIKIDLANVLTISLVAFASVWLINRSLDRVGYGQWRAA